MRKFSILAAVLAMVVIAAVPALAVTKNGGTGDDNIRGTNRADALSGGTGDDVLRGLGGPDTLSGGPGEDDIYGGSGRDNISGGTGKDFINDGNDGVKDVIDCGPGTDTVVADRVDDLEDCERVTRR